MVKSSLELPGAPLTNWPLKVVQVLLSSSIWQQLQPIWPCSGLGETSPGKFRPKSLLSEVFKEQSEVLQGPGIPVSLQVWNGFDCEQMHKEQREQMLPVGRAQLLDI